MELSVKIELKYIVFCFSFMLTALGSGAAEDNRADERLLLDNGIQVNVESIATYLRVFASVDQQTRYTKLVEQLGDPSFAKRQMAYKQLLRIPEEHIGILQEAVKSKDPEVRIRAGDVLKSLKLKPSIDRSGELLLAIARIVEQRKLKGLTEPLLATLPHLEGEHVQMQVATAAKASANVEDREAVMRCLKSDSQAIRIASVQVLGAFADSEQAIAALLDDNDHRVCMEAAFVFANRGDRKGLVKLVDLLVSHDKRVRQHSVRLLRALSGKNFGYTSDGKASDLFAAVAKWKAYATDSAAKFKFPIERPRRLTDGLILHYQFADVNGDSVVDQSGRGRHGTIVGAKLVQDKNRDQVCLLSGGQHVALPDGALSDLKTGTIAAWLRIDKVGDQQILSCVHRGGDEDIHVQFRTGNKGRLFAYLGTHELIGRLPSEQALKQGDWMFAVFTWATDRGAIYLDGERIANVKAADKSLFIPKTSRAFWIGRDTRKSYGAQDLRGAFDQLMVFNRELSPVEIKDLHQMQQ